MRQEESRTAFLLPFAFDPHALTKVGPCLLLCPTDRWFFLAPMVYLTRESKDSVGEHVNLYGLHTPTQHMKKLRSEAES